MLADLRTLLGGDKPLNVSRPERLLSVLGGGMLAGYGLRKGGAAGTLLGAAGAALVHRGATGHCAVYGTLGIDTAREIRQTPREADDEAGVSLQATATIGRPAAELYAFWRDFTQAPRYMERVVSVEVIDDETSRWTATGPRGRSWEWVSLVTEDRPGERIAWESFPGADLPNRGSVEFLPTLDGTATEVRYSLEFDPPGGFVGKAIASLFHEAPEEMIRGDLRRFRDLMETGGVPAAGAHSSGREG